MDTHRTAERLEPGGEEVASAFYAHYDALVDLVCPDYREMIEAAADAVPGWARTVADLGCGTGTLLAAIAARRPDLDRMTGIDLDPVLLAEAARKLGASPPASRALVQGDLLSAPLPVADAFVSSLVFHNLPPVAQALAYRRVARAARAFVQFEIVAGGTAAEEAERWEYLAWALAERGVPDDARAFTIGHMRGSDHPLTLGQHRALCDAVGLDLRVVRTAPGFVVFRADRRD